MTVDIEAINKRIDQVIAQNKKTEHVVVYVSIGIFLLGTSLLIIGILSEKVALFGFSLIISIFLYWPIKAILKIRKENMVLNTTAMVLQTCPSEKAIVELEKLLAFVRKQK